MYTILLGLVLTAAVRYVPLKIVRIRSTGGAINTGALNAFIGMVKCENVLSAISS